MEILCAVSNSIKNVGYCQGMNFIAAIIFLQLNDEESSYWMLMYLLQNKKYEKMYTTGLKKFRLACYQIENLIRQFLPKLYYYFVFLIWFLPTFLE